MDVKIKHKFSQTKIIVLVMLCCLLIPTNCKGYHYYIKGLIAKYDYIESIEEIIGWGGNSSDLPTPSAFDIKMENGRRLFLSYVEINEKTGKNYYPYYLDLIGNFVIYGRIPIDLIAKETGLDLETVEDIIVHYDTIYSFINTMTKLSEINEELSEGNKYHISPYGGGGYVGDEYREKVKSFASGDWRPLLVEIDKYPEVYKMEDIDENIPRETRRVYRRIGKDKREPLN
jgi:hypothetical protein